jgi:hypothetical protein
MQLFTFAQLKEKIGNAYDITDEVWVSEEELCDYINDAIDDAEGAIHNMHWEEKYFRTSTNLTLVSGTRDLVPPTDIYGNKILKIYYNNGSKRYEVRRIRDLIDTELAQPYDDYKYLIVNDTSNKAPRFRLYPTPLETGTVGTIWYIRNMYRVTTSLVDATNVCEVPECVNFVTQHVRRSLAKKSRNQAMIAVEANDLKVQYDLMLEALKDVTLDENNLVQMDTTFYDPFVDYGAGR